MFWGWCTHAQLKIFSTILYLLEYQALSRYSVCMQAMESWADRLGHDYHVILEPDPQKFWKAWERGYRLAKLTLAARDGNKIH